MQMVAIEMQSLHRFWHYFCVESDILSGISSDIMRQRRGGEGGGGGGGDEG